jgi:hypothetical protein
VSFILSLLNLSFTLINNLHREQSWRKSYTIPTAVLNHSHLNFVKRYTDIGRKISGFTKTKFDAKTASAFKIAWSRLGKGVEVLWKQAVVDPAFLGENHQPDSPGFVVLPELPPGRPDVIEPNHRVMLKTYVKELTGAGIRRALVPHLGDADVDSSIEWLRQSAQGYIPFDYENPSDENSSVAKSTWGPKVKVGVVGRQGNFFLMRDDIDRTDDHTGANFWALPSDIQACVDQSICDAIRARRELQGLPNIRYTDVSPAVARADQEAAAAAIIDSDSSDSPSASSAASSSESHFSSSVSSLSESSSSVSSRSSAPSSVSAVSADRMSRRIVPSAVEQKEKQYGASFEDCKKGCFALVHTEFEEEQGGIGIDMYKVQEAVPDGNPPSFWGTQYCPSKVGITVTDEQCLHEKWHAMSTARVSVLAWQVVIYFNNLTVGKKIPNVAKSKLTQATTMHNLVLFVPPMPDRIYPSIFIDDADQYEVDDPEHSESDD